MLGLIFSALVLQVAAQEGLFQDAWYDEFPFTEVDLTLENGIFTGKEIDTGFVKFKVFRAVPFGQAARFQPPTALPASTEKFDATEKAPSCYQSDPGYQTESSVKKWLDEGKITEDCLTVDLFIPCDAENSPILIWIYGGGFSMGSSQTYDGVQQVMKGNIVAIPNYRLGVFGYMSLYDPVTSSPFGGNMGLFDQKLAIQYIARNAAFFNGDASKITIYGESAGGMSVSLLIQDRDVASLVTTAIGQSGVVNNAFFASDFQFTQKANNIWKDVCDAVTSCQTPEDFDGSLTQTQAIISSLAAETGPKIWAEVYDAQVKAGAFTPGFWTPNPYDTAFFKQNPIQALVEGNLPTDVTYVVTTTSYEASSLLVREVFPGLDNMGLLFPDRPGNLDQLIENYLETFNKKVGVDIKRSDLNDDQAYILGTHIYTDLGFLEPGLLEAEAYAKAGANVYMLLFDMDARKDFVTEDVCCGVGHAGDLIYTFGIASMWENDWEAPVSNYIIDQFSSFANNGAPSDDWKQFTVASKEQLVLGNSENDYQAEMQAVTYPRVSRNAAANWAKITGADSSASKRQPFLNVVIFLIAFYCLILV